LGSVLAQTLSKQGHDISILSRDPHKQLALKPLLPKTTRYFLADICNHDAVREACRGQDVVVHAAAVKHVPVGEQFPCEFVRVNIDGTRVVANACREEGVGKALLISSDKSPNAENLYGATKRCAESIWLASDTNHHHFAALRYGNVVNSRGSVWHVWRDKVAQGLPIQVREPEPTRFILTVDEAIGLVQSALTAMSSHHKCIFVPSNVPAFSLWDLAREVQPDGNYWQVTHLEQGEKQHEVMLSGGEYATRVNNLLWRTCEYYRMSTEDRKQFCSETAWRLSGKDVVKKLDGK
jgi:UDP-N-acetylglucosamine 4,6-dehydratase